VTKEEKAMYEQVPEELKRLNQWVCVYKGDKAPQKAFERGAASSADPATWSDFETACAAVEEGYYDDIGFVFARGGGLVGIDIDLGFGGDGLPTPMAVDILRRCASYTELSRSGRGYHVFLKGDLPFDGRNGGMGVEIYSARRYFIVTGRRVVYPDIAVNPEAIEYVLNTYIPASAPAKDEGGREKGKPLIYAPRYKKPAPCGRVDLTPDYPSIQTGLRHISMVSLAGSLRAAGLGAKRICEELLRANEIACKPPLPAQEIRQIAKSIQKYEK